MTRSATLDGMRRENPAHAEYVDRLIAWCRAEGPSYERASVAAEAVRGIVRVGDTEWQVLTETFGEPGPIDWERAQAAYGPTAGLPGTVR